MRRVYVLRGEGIECDRESARFFADPRLACEVRDLPLPRLSAPGFDLRREARAGDLFFLPGGFSFADHFGSGRLLAVELKRLGFFEACLDAGAHLMGVCNGFQMLVEAGLFGEGVKLRHNRLPSGRSHFVNRWVKCESPWSETPLTLPVRHGEGRLERAGARWEEGVEPCLFYRDPVFANGSVDEVAGLWAARGRSRVLGLMPHPEIAARPLQNPDVFAAENFPQFREALETGEGDGLRFVRAALSRMPDEGGAHGVRNQEGARS